MMNSTTASGEAIQTRNQAIANAMKAASNVDESYVEEGEGRGLFKKIESGTTLHTDADTYINAMRAKAAVTEYLIANASEIKKNLREFMGKAAPYLDDDKTVDITRNPDGTIWVKQLGGVEFPISEWTQRFRDASRLCQEVAASGGLSFTPDEPHLEYIVPFHGARFTATMMPIVSGIMWRIRKRNAQVLYLEDYFKNNQISEPLYKRLLVLIKQNKNILIVAGQGTGKTTLANAILNTTYQMYPDTRFAIIEDTPEIQCVAPNRYEMLTCDRLGFTFGRLIPMQLRYGAHSLTFGEIRSAALAYLEQLRVGSVRTGVATIHGKNEVDAFGRIEDIILKETGHEVRPRTLYETIGGIVVMKAVQDGLPRITRVTWANGHTGSEYQFEPNPRSVAAGMRPRRRPAEIDGASA